MYLFYQLILLSVFYNLLYMHLYGKSYMTCVWLIWSLYLKWNDFQKTWLESRRTWSECFPDNFSMKCNRKEYLLNICCMTGTVLTVWHFISIYRGPSRGVPLEGGWGKEGKRLKWLHPLCSHSHQFGHPVHQSKGGDLAYVSSKLLPSSLPALRL